MPTAAFGRSASGTDELRGAGFDNGHLASVVPDAEDDQRWELAVLDGSGGTNSTTPIGPGAIGSLTLSDVRRILRQIQALP